MTPRLILDPGHGGADSGACLIFGKTVIATERQNNLEMCLTIKALLKVRAPGLNVVLTRINAALPGGGFNDAPALANFQARTSKMGGCDVYASVHYDSATARAAGGVYYSDDRTQRNASKELAKTIQDRAGGWLAADSESRHGRLYIRDAKTRCAVLWEVAPIQEMTRIQRIEKAERFCRAVCEFLAVPYDAHKPL